MLKGVVASAALAMLALVLMPARASAEGVLPQPLAGIDIEDKRGAFVPKDARLVDQDGHDTTLGAYFDDGKPVVLVMAYYECPMLCSMVLTAVKNGVKDLAWTAGKDFRVVTVSFDPRDTPEKAKAKREAYLKAYGRDVGAKGWDFLVGKTEADVARIADAVGFRYRWDEKTSQYAHAAGSFYLGPDGKLSQTLYGLEFKTRDVRLALTEASEGKLGTAMDKVLLLCFHYDPAQAGYVVRGIRIVKGFGALTGLLLFGLLARLWRQDLQRERTRTQEAS